MQNTIKKISIGVSLLLLVGMDIAVYCRKKKMNCDIYFTQEHTGISLDSYQASYYFVIDKCLTVTKIFTPNVWHSHVKDAYLQMLSNIK
jgi:hypothetical protein